MTILLIAIMMKLVIIKLILKQIPIIPKILAKNQSNDYNIKINYN
jgi:hypothetical protein